MARKPNPPVAFTVSRGRNCVAAMAKPAHNTVDNANTIHVELEMKTEAEVEDLTDELSDEALDRAEGALCYGFSAARAFMRLWW